MTKTLREGAGSADRDDIPTASPATGESFAEQIARVGLMSEGDPQWDLSENDCAALHAVLCSHDDLLAALKVVLKLSDYWSNTPQVKAVVEAAISHAEGSHV